jgi:hypothetical protein
MKGMGFSPYIRSQIDSRAAAPEDPAKPVSEKS